MAETPECSEVQDVLPELALGVASGEVRARALAHLVGCSDCRLTLAEVSVAVDELLTLAPQVEPPAGFEARVLSAMARPEPRHRLRATMLVAAAVAVAVLAAGITWWHDAGDRSAADDYQQVLGIAHGSSMRAAPLNLDGRSVGTVFAYQGRPSWVFVTVAGVTSGKYHVSVVTTDGSTHWIGLCDVRDGAGSWGTAVKVPVAAVQRLQLYGDGLPTVTADLRA